MAVYDVTTEQGHTVARKRHPVALPFWNGIVIAFGTLVLLWSFVTNAWAAGLAVAFIAAVICWSRRRPLA